VLQRSEDAGATWQKIPVPTTNDLYSINFPDSTGGGWIVDPGYKNLPVAISLAVNMSPSQGSSFSLAPLTFISSTSASPSGRRTVFPKLGLAKLPASGASGGKGRGLPGRANCLSSSAYFVFAHLSASAA